MKKPSYFGTIISIIILTMIFMGGLSLMGLIDPRSNVSDAIASAVQSLLLGTAMVYIPFRCTAGLSSVADSAKTATRVEKIFRLLRTDTRINFTTTFIKNSVKTDDWYRLLQSLQKKQENREDKDLLDQLCSAMIDMTAANETPVIPMERYFVITALFLCGWLGLGLGINSWDDGGVVLGTICIAIMLILVYAPELAYIYHYKHPAQMLITIHNEIANSDSKSSQPRPLDCLCI